MTDPASAEGRLRKYPQLFAPAEDRCSECGVPIAEHPYTDACAIAQESRADPASAEGLRAALDRLMGELAESPLPGARYAYDVVERRRPAIEAAALRDTGPRPDSGLDVERLAKAMRRTRPYGPEPDAWALQAAKGIAAEYACLSTPRTETSETLEPDTGYKAAVRAERPLLYAPDGVTVEKNVTPRTETSE